MPPAQGKGESPGRRVPELSLYLGPEPPLGYGRAQERLPVEMRQQVVEAVYAGQSFRTVLRDLNLTSNQVWGMARGVAQVAPAAVRRVTRS
jgi:hypothetical protein